ARPASLRPPQQPQLRRHRTELSARPAGPVTHRTCGRAEGCRARGPSAPIAVGAAPILEKMMSRKNKFRASLAAASARLGGSHLTREARQRTTATFTKVMYQEGFTHLTNARNISGRHLRIYVAVRKAQGIGLRTLQNELAHLRGILRSARNHAIADAPELTNGELGIGGGSRL